MLSFTKEELGVRPVVSKALVQCPLPQRKMQKKRRICTLKPQTTHFVKTKINGTAPPGHGLRAYDYKGLCRHLSIPETRYCRRLAYGRLTAAQFLRSCSPWALAWLLLGSCVVQRTAMTGAAAGRGRKQAEAPLLFQPPAPETSN